MDFKKKQITEKQYCELKNKFGLYGSNNLYVIGL